MLDEGTGRVAVSECPVQNPCMSKADRLRSLHRSGTFVIPNPDDVGAARLLARLGFQALASTSSGFAATLGRRDMHVTLEELVEHAAALAAATELPLSVDAERGFDDPAETVERLAQAGAAGCSIEDWNPTAGRIEPLTEAVARVRAAVDAGRQSGLVITARCENHLHGVNDLDDTIGRLVAYRDVGAECVYAPGLVDLDDISRVVTETRTAVNVLLRPGGPTVAQLAAVGVRRVSVGGALAYIARGAFVAAAERLLHDGTIDPHALFLDSRLAAQAWGET
jgi:2-methylisocitrate lyase-like PEP mutase family enzyme